MTATSEWIGEHLVASRHLHASCVQVWAAFTSTSGVAAFWGGSHATVPAESVTIDLRPGGEFSLDTRGPDGRQRRLTFSYVCITPTSELVFDEAATGLRTAITMRPDGEGTLLRVHQSRLPADLRTEQARLGLAAILDALATHLVVLSTSERSTR